MEIEEHRKFDDEINNIEYSDHVDNSSTINMSTNINSIKRDISDQTKDSIGSFPVVSITDTDCADEQDNEIAKQDSIQRRKYNTEKDIFKIKTVGKKNLEPLPTLESYLEKSDRKSWGYKSVLFWKQDSVSIASSTDTEDVHSLNDFKDDIYSPESPETSTTSHEVDELLREVEDLQRKFIDPLVQGDEEVGSDGSDTTNSGSPVYLLEIPENSIERYSPIYKGISECLDKILQIYDNDMKNSNASMEETNLDDLEDVQISTPGNSEVCPTSNGEVRATQIIRSKQLEDTEACTDFDLEDAKSTITAFINSDRYKPTIQGDLLNLNVLDGIKMVQQTLVEIGHEIKNVRKGKNYNCKKDPNIILGDLLAQIRPPRDSRTSFPKLPRFSELGRIDSEDPPTDSVDCDSTAKTCEQVCKLTPSVNTTVSVEINKVTGDMYKGEKYTKPDVSQDEVNSAGSHNHVYENLGELKQVVCDGLPNVDWRNRSPDTTPMRKTSLPLFTVCNSLEVDASPQTSPLYERRGSAWSTTLGIMNYDSGFSEFPRSSNEKSDQPLTSPEVFDNQRVFQQSFSSKREDIESETSTDWSPNSTLSRDQSLRKQKLVSRNVRCRSSPKRRSNPSSKGNTDIGTTLSCPNFSQYLNTGNSSANMYNKAELNAIRKFLAVTSQYFSTKVDEDESKREETQDEDGDVLTIQETIQKQRDDLDKQRQQQEDLLHQIGDMLLEIVNLKEEHISVRQRQAKALTILKKQLDHYRKEQEKAQKDLKDQVKQLGDKLDSQMSLIHDRSWLDSPASSDRLSVSTNQDSMVRGEIVWKITNVAKKISKIHSGLSEGVVVSDHFYSQHYGYKMAAWLYLNGRGEYRTKGMSVYVCILVGEYDAILNWPVRPRYRFALVDQNTMVENRRDHVKVRRVLDIANRGENAIAKHGGIPRPQPGAKSLIVGFDDFISQRELSSRNFVLDDTIFFKISADSFS